LDRFRDASAVVTGAASGIGAATARRLAAEGAAVLLVDIDDAGLAAVTKQIDAAGGSASALPGDVSDPELWHRVHDTVEAAHGRLDVLHSNAFVDRTTPAHELSLEEWNRVVAVDLTAAYLAVHALQPLFRPGTAIVLTSSVHALFGLPGHPAYAAAKGGLRSLAQQLAVDYGPDVRVNSVLPGPIRTAAWAGIDETAQAQSAAQTVAGRMGTADEVAAAVAFLASADASYVTGASLVVDGGWSIFKDSA
jgi:NAD(P)-dependent dehydrogenase (short-subunit alcohol dehydrogenase family)